MKLFLIVVLAMALALIGMNAATPNELAKEHDDAADDHHNIVLRHNEDDLLEADDINEESSSVLGGSMMGRLLLQSQKIQNRHRRTITCDKYPRICHSKGSPGPHCCKKKCVDVRRDRLNCGMCGKKCKYNESCCNGKCINPSSNKRHCGGCNHKCAGRASSCVLGLCNYSN